MRFLLTRASQGAVSKDPPCRGAVRGSESKAWPGEHLWFIDLGTLEDLVAFLHNNGGALGLFAPEEDEEYPTIEIFDDDEDEEEDSEED
ncbi:MAG TPA: hypothetical protein VEL76_41930 [Gemmataceae bacterium]|nr:hypothetical protein [Gemmataceae bacterium]